MQPDIDGIGLDRKKTPMPTIDNMRGGSTEIQVMVRPRSTLFVFPCSPGILPASWGGDVASAGVSARACSSAAAAVWTSFDGQPHLEVGPRGGNGKATVCDGWWQYAVFPHPGQQTKLQSFVSAVDEEKNTEYIDIHLVATIGCGTCLSMDVVADTFGSLAANTIVVTIDWGCCQSMDILHHNELWNVFIDGHCRQQ